MGGEHPSPTLAMLNSEPSQGPSNTSISIIVSLTHDSERHTKPVQSDLDKPISIRKRVRMCTKHPLSHHVTYSYLPPLEPLPLALLIMRFLVLYMKL